jgi:hypothetical protein
MIAPGDPAKMAAEEVEEALEEEEGAAAECDGLMPAVFDYIRLDEGAVRSNCGRGASRAPSVDAAESADLSAGYTSRPAKGDCVPAVGSQHAAISCVTLYGPLVDTWESAADPFVGQARVPAQGGYVPGIAGSRHGNLRSATRQTSQVDTTEIAAVPSGEASCVPAVDSSEQSYFAASMEGPRRSGWRRPRGR